MGSSLFSCAHCARLLSKFMTTGAAVELRRTISRGKFLVYGEDVMKAKETKQPIVALESTIITHGMPYPNNLETALRVEDVVRKQGAVPATIGIMDGKIYVGMNKEQLETLSKTDPVKTLKCSRRDVSFVMSKGLNGGTTVSATLLIANLADISIMATGGIGGVHRQAETTFDISADLIELGHTPVAVVCSGVKSILDIGKTLEYLETQGVPVVTLGNCNDFPAFFCQRTFDKLQAPHSVSSSKEAANFINIQRALGLQNGILFAVPIPEEYALDPEEMETAIHKCLEKARSEKVTGKALTPFLLKELNELTKGQTLGANMALIENNAKTAAQIARDLHKKMEETSAYSASVNSRHKVVGKPIVVGGAVFDTILQVKDPTIKEDGRTHVGRSRESCGGVGRNIADALIKLGLESTRLISVIGNDGPGRAIIKSVKEAAATLELLPNANTARYTAIIDSQGECRFGIGEMDVLAAIDPALIKRHQSQLEEASLIILDGNLPMETIRVVVDIAAQAEIPVWYEPTDVRKASKIFESGSQWQKALHFISPNRYELLKICNHFGIAVPDETSPVDLIEIRDVAENLAEYIPVVISTLGSEGVLVARRASKNDPFYDLEGKLIRNSSITSRLYSPLSYVSKDINESFSSSGCGDCLTAGIISGIINNFDEARCVSLGLKAASLSLKSLDPVPSTLSTIDVTELR